MFNKRVEEIIELKELITLYTKEFKEVYVAALPEGDTRSAVFAKCLNCLYSALYAFEYAHSKLEYGPYVMYKHYELLERPLNGEEAFLIWKEFYMFNKIAMQLLMFSSMESSLRAIYESLGLGKIEDGFYKIYMKLLKELELEEFSNLIDMLRLIRNTLHNNGVFISSMGKEEVIEYKGNFYRFEHRKAIDMTGVSILTDLYKEMLFLLTKIMRHEKVRDIEYIEDPYYEGYKSGLNGKIPSEILEEYLENCEET